MEKLVRAFVVTLTLAGSVAYTQIHTSSKNTPTKISAAQPNCPPGGNDLCGWPR